MEYFLFGIISSIGSVWIYEKFLRIPILQFIGGLGPPIETTLSAMENRIIGKYEDTVIADLETKLAIIKMQKQMLDMSKDLSKISKDVDKKPKLHKKEIT